MGAGRGYDHVELRALSTLAQKGVWAVGRRYDPATEDDDAIALRWNGSSWGERPITLQPDTSFGDTRLYDVQAIESSYALAVGVDNNWPLFLRWNGKTWKEQVKPDSRAVPYSGLHVNSIRAADTDDAWAVGYSSPTSGPASTLILRWNGKKWRIFDSPNVGEYDNVLTAVKPGCCRMWAVGYYDVPDGAGGFRHQTLVLSWDDRHKVWEIQNSLNFSGSNQLFAIDGQVLSAWAVGSFGETSPQPMALACC
jgi:hypothetical protein